MANAVTKTSYVQGSPDDGPPDMSQIPVTSTTPETGPEPELINRTIKRIRLQRPTKPNHPIRTSVVIPVDNENLVKGFNWEKLDIVYEFSCLCIIACMSSGFYGGRQVPSF